MDAEVIVIGCGPAGLQAAIHCARKKVKTVVIGHPERGGLNKAEIENYFGVVKTSGKELLRVAMEQTRRFGAEVFEEDVMKAEKKDDGFIILTDRDHEFKARALILAPGISRIKLNVEGEKEFLGKGVSYCASCDCNFFRGKRVAVIGDQSMAATSAALMTGYAAVTYWISRKLDVPPELMEKVKATPAQILSPAWPKRILGGDVVSSIELEDGGKMEVEGVFIELGATGSADLALELNLLPDPSGIITVNQNMETEVPGLFACGDVTGQPWQLARAVGQGCIAGTNAAKFAKYGPGGAE